MATLEASSGPGYTTTENGNGPAPPLPSSSPAPSIPSSRPPAVETADPPPVEAPTTAGPVPPPEYEFDEGGVPVFRPTTEQFANFEKFIKSIEGIGAEAGIVKVVPPKAWKDALPDVRTALASLKIKKAMKQSISGGSLPSGCFFQMNEDHCRTYTVQEWYEASQSGQYQAPRFNEEGRAVFDPLRTKRRPTKDISDVHDPVARVAPELAMNPIGEGSAMQPQCNSSITFDLEETSSGFDKDHCSRLERHYWRNVTFAAPLYGADMLGSLFDHPTIEEAARDIPWNLTRLPNLLNRVNLKLPGVNLPYLYFGMWKSTFAWHVEDMDLYSINYIHFGAPKQWYVIPQESRGRFETAMQSNFRNDHAKCNQFLRHKSSICSPKVLERKGIKVNRVVQHAGEFMITFPFGYHQGYNMGFNCAESVNFATDSWIPIGKQATFCPCVPDSVRLDVSALFDPPVVRKIKLVVPNGPSPNKRERENSENGDFETNSTAQARPVLAPKKRRKVKAATSSNVPNSKDSMPASEREKSPVPAMKCVLCPTTSGLLLPTDKPNVWAHRSCATFIPETRVEAHPMDAGLEIVIGIDAIAKARWRLKCAICRVKGLKLPKSGLGACIQCAKGRCVVAYHVTCAMEADQIYTNDAQENPHCFCTQHNPERQFAKQTEKFQLLEEAARNFTPGLPVSARSEGQWYDGLISEVDHHKQSCRIAFADGTNRVIKWSMIQPRNSHPPSAHHSVHQTPLSSPAMPQPLMRMKVESVSFPGFHIKRETIAEPISPIKSPHEKIPMLPSSVESSMAMEDVRFSPSRGQYGLSTDHEAYDNLTRRLSFPNHPMNLPPPSPSHVQRVPTDPYRHSASFNLPTPSPSHGHVPMDAYRYYGWGHARGYPPVPHNGYPVHPTHIERPHEPWQPHADQWQRSGEQWQRPGEHFQPGNTLPPISCLFQQSIYDGSAPMSMSDNSSGFPPYPIYTRTQHYQQAI